MKRKDIELKQEFNINGLFPPQNLTVEFQPSPKQYEMWKCLEPNSCNLCGGEIIRKKEKDHNGTPLYTPVCKDCGNDNIPQLILGGGSAGGGKALIINELVCTPYGFRKIGDLKTGDNITSPYTGGMQKVLYAHPIEKHKCYEIEFIDGTKVKASEGHLWTTWITSKTSKRKTLDGKKYNYRLMRSVDIFNFYENKNKGLNQKCNITVPLTAPVKFTTGTNVRGNCKIPPYSMGAILGDGSIASGKYMVITSADKYIVERVHDELSNVFNDAYEKITYDSQKKIYIYRTYSKQLQIELDTFGLSCARSDTKFIPSQYKTDTLENRYHIINGLMDTDGYVDDRGHMSYTSVSKQMATDFKFISDSLGAVSTITVDTNSGYKDNDGNFVRCQDAHTVYIRSENDKKFVSLPRKLKRCKDGFNGGVSELGKRIVGIKYIGEHECRCITVDEPHATFLTNNFTVTHNSYVGCTWIAMNCIRFAGIRAVIARKTLKSLTGSTWKTLLEVLDRWGLIEGVNYKTNEKDGTLLFWNGSSIVKQELELLPRDPTYQRLGSSEFTIGFIDEVGEIAEKGVEVLYSRLRYKVNETFKVPKMLLSTNPVPNWVRERFVQDKNGDPIITRRNEVYVPFSVYDNPNKEFVQVYAASLANMRDEKEKQRLLYGNWDFISTSDIVIYKQFNGDKHLIVNLFDKKYNPLLPLTFVWDFNVLPQMSVLMCQIDYNSKNIYIFREFAGTPKQKNNSTPAMARDLAAYMRTLGHTGGYNITGDPSGLQRSTATEVGVNNYTIIEDAIRNQGLHASRMLLTKTPPQKTRCDFVNMIFSGELGWNIYIDLSCRLLAADLMYQEENPDGTKSKKKFTDPETGSKYEKYGHFSDNLDYFIVMYLSNLFSSYSGGNLHTNGDVDYSRMIVSASPKPKFNF